MPDTTGPPTTIITGAGSGIGRAAAVLLSGLGHRTVLVGRRAEPLRETAALLAAESEPLAADIAEPAAAPAIVAAALGRFGRIDNLVNNAGLAPLAEIGQTTPAMVSDVFAVNALGPANLIAACWPHMAARRSGCIVNISTLGTADPFPGFFAYASAKAAVNSMARSCAKEGRAVGIRAFAVAPGAVETAMLRGNFPLARLPASAAIGPEAVARLIADCIAGTHDARNGDTLFIAAGKGVW